MAKIAFLGMGVMGFPMAGHLAKAGHEVTVYNRTRAKADAWTQKHKGGLLPRRPSGAGQDYVMACVGNDNDLRSVVHGDAGAFKAMRKGAIFVDHTTASAEIARELGCRGQEGRLRLSRRPGLRRPERCRERPARDHGRRRCRDLRDGGAGAQDLRQGDHADRPRGSGQLTKMVNQICIAGLLQGLSEGMNFAAKSGLDASRRCCRSSPRVQRARGRCSNRAKTMVAGKFDFGFAVDWMRKDLGICLAEAQRNKARLPVTALVDQFYAQVQARGGGRWDTSSLIHLLAKD